MDKELSRQVLHLFVGVVLAVVASVLSSSLMSALLIGLFVGCVVVFQTNNVLSRVLLSRFGRKHSRGAGVLWMLAGFIVTSLLFPAQLVASMLVLAIADSFSTIIGRQFSLSGPCWQGSLAFVVFSSAVLVFFSSSWLLISVFLALVEAYKFGVNDNFSIPILTGLLVFVS